MTIRVDLWEITGMLGLIVSHPSGIVFSNQVGGSACLHPEREGVYIPVLRYDPDSDSDPDPLLDIVNARAEAAELFLHNLGIDNIFELRLDDGPCHEAWIPVRVIDARELEHLRPFVGKHGVLTYANSD